MISNRMLQKVFLCFAVLFLSSAVWADEPRLTVIETQDEGNGFSSYALSELMWPRSSDGYTRIPVCWTQSRGMYLQQKGIVRQAVTSTWEANSLVRFIGWGDCDDTSPFNPNAFNGIRIGLTNEVPYSYLGTGSNYQRVSMALNMSMSTTPGFTACGRPNNPTEEQCEAWTAAHEFGHALGFSHEQNRADTPYSCKDKGEPYGRFGEISIGNWDLYSITNYCNPRWNNFGALSPMDRLALKAFYDHLAIADFTTGQVIIPVGTMMGMSYNLTLQANATLSEFKVVGLVPTAAVSSSPASFNETTLALTIPFIAVTLDGIVSNVAAAEGVVLVYDVRREAFVLVNVTSVY